MLKVNDRLGLKLKAKCTMFNWPAASAAAALAAGKLRDVLVAEAAGRCNDSYLHSRTYLADAKRGHQ